MTGIGDDDAFEQRYDPRFDQLIADADAIPIQHRFDFGIDRGAQFMGPSTANGRRPATHARVWFQLKGKKSTTVSPEQFVEADALTVRVSKKHLRFWYAAPEPIYLVVYVESVDTFLHVDVRDLVDERWGTTFYAAVTDSDGTVTVDVPTNAVLDASVLRTLDGRRTMRIDGPSFRGQPLGHRFDPLRSVFAAPEPATWRQIIDDLLTHHGFLVEHTHSMGLLTFVHGTVAQSMSWQSPAFTEIGYSSAGAPRDEAEAEQISTYVALVIDDADERDTLSDHEREAFARFAAELSLETDWAVFARCRELHSHHWRTWFRQQRGIRPDGPGLHVIGMDSLSNLLLRAPLVYFDYASRLQFSEGPGYL